MKSKKSILKVIVFLFVAAILVITAGMAVKLLKEDYAEERTFNDIQKVVERSDDDILSKLKKRNSDVIGYLEIPDTTISYPVMQSKNNPDFYLNHDIDRNYSFYGTPYLSAYCDLEKSDNLIIYGHNINGGRMFGALTQYKDEGFYQKHKKIYFTIREKSKYEIFAVISVNKYEFPYWKFVMARDINNVFYAVCDSAIYILLSVNVFNKIISIGEFSSLFQATSKFGGAIRGIVNSYLEMNYTSSVLKYYIDFVEDIYGENDRLMDLSDCVVEVTDKACEIEFRDVSFKYPNTDKYILKDISVKIKAGEHMAIVGQNGAGKTTFIKLLCNLYDNYEGKILVNGKDAREYNFVDYMKMLSVVFQDFRLFAFTIQENVTVFDDKNMDLEEIYKIAGINQWIESLDEKDQTYIYKMFVESGVEPSGGESQKLAIARALYKNAPIVVLDEPTAALDPISEYEVYKNFDKLVYGKTAIYISHRLSSCRFCDRIIVFNNGTITEEGSHEELMKNTDGLYYNMYSTQAKHYK